MNLSISKFDVIVIGAGLAGCEAALQAAARGLKVKLVEMRPVNSTGAHKTDDLAELVCSNSLGSSLPDRSSGCLKNELRKLNSFLINAADQCSVPAGRALAVDRQIFSSIVEDKIKSYSNIEIFREEAKEIPSGMVIIASGPLTSPALSKSIAQLTGSNHLYFFDALAPIVDSESIDFNIAFFGSRYQANDQQVPDYINLPFSKEQYYQFVNLIASARQAEIHEEALSTDNETAKIKTSYFEACLPIEILARRGPDALAYGPMRPVGLKDPRIGTRPYAVIQLRKENLVGTLYNMVGFQTNLTYPEQLRVFQTIPGLKNVEFVRFGQMHRNTYINSPNLLLSTFQMKNNPNIFFAGQIAGVEGYAGNIASGLMAGWNAARLNNGQKPLTLPQTTIIGALSNYISNADPTNFQPMKDNFGILPSLNLENKLTKRDRAVLYSERSLVDLTKFLQTYKNN